MRIIAFILELPVIERMWNRCAIPPAAITTYVREPIAAPAVLPARAPPQAEMDFDQVAGSDEWPDMDQTAGKGCDTWG